MQAVATFVWDSGLIWLLLLAGAVFLRSFLLALGAYVLFLGIGWIIVGESPIVGLTMLVFGAGLVYYGIRERGRD